MIHAVNTNLDIDTMISLSDQLEIWSNLTGYDINKLKGKFRNPFREDDNPDCFLFWNPDLKQLKLIDFARRDKSGYISQILRNEFDLDNRAIKDYLRPFVRLENKGIIPHLDDFESKPFEFLVKIRPFTTKDNLYWDKYGVNIDFLEQIGIVAVDKYIIGENIFKPSHAYGYKYQSGNRRIYQPYKRNNKFIGNSGESDIYFSETLKKESDNIIIASGFKDAIILKSITDNPVIAFHSESFVPSNEVLLKLTTFAKGITIIYDNDPVGIKYSSILENKINDIFPMCTNLTSLLPEGKDIALTYLNNKDEWKKIICQL